MNKLLTKITILLLFLSCERGWLNEIINPKVDGCMDSKACNYNAEAEEDDGSCINKQGCNDWCEGALSDIKETDCAGICGGIAVIDDCGMCTGGNTNYEFNFWLDCNGECYPDSHTSCNQTENPDCGQAQEDNCGVCDNDPTNDCTEDCFGVVCNRVCNGNTAYYNGVCSDGSCSYTSKDCDNGCIDGYCITESDQCLGVDCSSFCNGSTAYYDGICLDGACSYTSEYCSNYCSGGTCISSNGADCSDANYCSDCLGCESSCCPNYCSGNYYYYNRSCSNGFCIGATSDYCPNGCNENGCQ